MNGYEQMREALKHCIEELQPYCDGVARIDDVLEEAQAALALPRRQCDVGTAEEQNRRMTDFCNSRHCENCPVYDSESCALAWSQMPYEEGGAK